MLLALILTAINVMGIKIGAINVKLRFHMLILMENAVQYLGAQIVLVMRRLVIRVMMGTSLMRRGLCVRSVQSCVHRVKWLWMCVYSARILKLSRWGMDRQGVSVFLGIIRRKMCLNVIDVILIVRLVRWRGGA